MSWFKPNVQKMASKSDIPGLIKALSYGKRLHYPTRDELKIRTDATEALRRLADLRALPPLLKVLGSKNVDLAKRATRALVAICKCSNSESTYTAVIESFLRELSGPSFLGKGDVDREIVEALVVFDLHAVPSVLRLLTEETVYGKYNVQLKEACIRILARINHYGAVRPLIQLLSNSNTHLAYEAATALAEFPSPETVTALLEVSKSADTVLSDRALASLARVVEPGMGIPSAPLIKEFAELAAAQEKKMSILSSVSSARGLSSRQVALASLLGALGDVEAIDVLIKVFETASDPAAQVINNVLRQLGVSYLPHDTVVRACRAWINEWKNQDSRASGYWQYGHASGKAPPADYKGMAARLLADKYGLSTAEASVIAEEAMLDTIPKAQCEIVSLREITE